MATYKKRSGTSGIRGQLYETKLISIILFRAKHNKRIEQFQLATNVNEIGTFDDICFKAKVEGFDLPVAVFIQAKHRENDKSPTLHSKNDLAKYFDSYMKVRRAFKPNNEDLLFDGKFEETECFFVMYTTAKDDMNNNLFQSSFADNLYDLIGTGDIASQPSYETEDVEFLCKIDLKEQINNLAAYIAKFVYDEIDFSAMLNDELAVRYHVILAQKVLNVSEIQPEGHRNLSFRQEFFDTNEEFILLFKDKLFMEILKKRKVDDKEIIAYLSKSQESTFTSDSSMLSKLIGSVITYNQNGKLEFVNKSTSDELKQQLNKVNVSQSTVGEAVELAAKEILTSRDFKLKAPAAFGNKDLTISGNDKKIERRLKFLTGKILELLKNSKPSNIVTIDEALGDGLLSINGGIGGAVGNILVSEENTKLMKFTDNSECLGDRAKRLFGNLKDGVDNLAEYRFEVKVKKFPKILFDYSEYDINLAKDFLKKLLFYTNQADENDVEIMLKKEIEEHRCSNECNFQVIADAIFLNYHDKIQKWWMTPIAAEYLTKDCDFYDITVKNIISNRLISIISFIYNNKIKHIDYTFKEVAVKSLELQDQLLRTVIVSASIALTVAKVKQYFENRDHIVLDLEYILHLPRNECNALCDELKKTSKEKLLIFVCDNVPDSRYWSKTLDDTVKAVCDKKIIIITNQMLVVTIKKYFSPVDNVVNDSRSSLIDMSEESQEKILENARVIFQGEEVRLKLIMNDASIELVEGDVLNRIINKEINIVGKPISNPNYDEIKHLYVERRVSSDKLPEKKILSLWGSNNDKVIETLNDIEDDVVLITALPGMGKSTLLTHLSLKMKELIFKTKEFNPRVWIVRINLLDYSREFNEWQENKTVIDTLESLNFMCPIILSEKHGKVKKVTITVEQSNGDVYLKDYTGDQWTAFEVKLFLHFFNNEELIFLFDGFDEICPHYTNEVISLLKTVRSYPRKHRMWITSRSYNKIKSTLEDEFGTSYEIEHFTSKEQEQYLEKFWKSHLILTEFNSTQLDNVYDFIEVMLEKQNTLRPEYLAVKKLSNLPLHVIYINALNYLKNEIIYTQKFKNKDAELVVIKERLVVKYNHGYGGINSMFDFVGSPLHLYLIADYFQSEIKDVNKKANKWNLDVNTFAIYERFLVTKLKKIRFQEKNKMDIYNPDILNTYNKERVDFILKHKKLAAYAIFHRNNHELFSKNELKDIKSIIKVFKKGDEKTGLIHGVTSDNIPIFVHMTFAEYFAVEHICDLLKNAKSKEKQESMMDFIFNVIFFRSPTNVLNILDTKIKVDKELMSILEKNEKVIFDLLMAQSIGFVNFLENKKTSLDFQSSLTHAVSENLSNFVCFIITIFERNVNEDNFKDFIKIVKKTRLIFIAVDVECDKAFIFTLDIVRKFDKSKLIYLLDNPIYIPPYLKKYNEMSNEEILEYIRTRRMRRRPKPQRQRLRYSHVSAGEEQAPFERRMLVGREAAVARRAQQIAQRRLHRKQNNQ